VQRVVLVHRAKQIFQRHDMRADVVDMEAGASAMPSAFRQVDLVIIIAAAKFHSEQFFGAANCYL
jgi:Ni,Fe-hydrogenase maturation factor